jgi:hypothetical protein
LAIPFGLLGARLLHVLDDCSYFWHHPGRIITLQSELLHGASIALCAPGGAVGEVETLAAMACESVTSRVWHWPEGGRENREGIGPLRQSARRFVGPYLIERPISRVEVTSAERLTQGSAPVEVPGAAKMSRRKTRICRHGSESARSGCWTSAAENGRRWSWRT